MPIYRYTNLCTMYEAKINGETLGKHFRQSACYGSSLQYFIKRTNEASYSIMLITNDSFVTDNKNNYCWMTKHQLENYLRRIATIKPFTYKVSEVAFGGSALRIDLSFTGSRKEATFVLQCIKRCYEWPYNFFLHQAYKMQELPAFKFESILNLFNVASATYVNWQNTDHCFSGNTFFEKYKTLREKLPHITWVVDLYPRFAGDFTKRVKKLPGIYYNGDVPGNSEQWSEVFEKNLPFYVENYNNLNR